MSTVRISVERDFPRLDELQLTTAEDMREIGLLARETIIRRTREGLGPNGEPLEPLSEGYATRKQAALGHARADLTVSGDMLNGIQIVEVAEDRVTLGWEE